MSKVGIGIIGTGVGLRTLLPGFRLLENAEVIAISGSSPERSKYFASKNEIPVACPDYHSLCKRDDIDLVCVTTPNSFHFEHTLVALEHGKNVLCEKPFTLSENEMEMLIAKKNASGKFGLVDHQLRFNPYLLKIRELLKSNTIGRPYFVRIHQQSTGFADDKARWTWSFDSEQGGGVRYAMCSHLADLLHFWFGSSFHNLTAVLNPVFQERIDSNGNLREILASTFCNVHLELENDISVSLSITAGAFSKPRFDVSIYGDKGELQFDLDNKLSLFTNSTKNLGALVNCSELFQDEKNNKISIFTSSFRYFAPKIVEAIAYSDATKIENASTFEDARYTFRLLDAVGTAANQGGLVNLKKKQSTYI